MFFQASPDDLQEKWVPYVNQSFIKGKFFQIIKIIKLFKIYIYLYFNLKKLKIFKFIYFELNKIVNNKLKNLKIFY
jgi:hypothetical protein